MTLITTNAGLTSTNYDRMNAATALMAMRMAIMNSGNSAVFTGGFQNLNGRLTSAAVA